MSYFSGPRRSLLFGRGGAAGPGGVLSPFRGNMDVTISAINTSGGILLSHSSGQLPFGLQVSAAAILATGTSRPLEDLHFDWDFGDPTGTELFQQPLNSTLTKYAPWSVNINKSQTGGQAFYFYRSAGTYTITLTIRGRSGGGRTSATASVILAVITTTVTASAFSGTTRYVDQINGNSSWDGTAPIFVSGTTGPRQSIADINGFIGSNPANFRVLLAQKSHWAGANGIDSNLWAGGVDTSNLRIGNYVGASGAGANPLVDINSGGNNAFHLDHSGSHAHNDTVISGIDFTDSGSATTGTVVSVLSGQNATTINDLYFDNCNAIETLNLNGPHSIIVIVQWTSGAFSTQATQTMNRGAWYGGSIISPQPIIGNSAGFFGGAQNWYAWFGLTISGSSNDSIRDHHIYPSCQNHALYRYVNFQSGPSRNYCINGNYDALSDDPVPAIASDWLVSDCYLSGTGNGMDAANGFPGNDPTIVRVRGVVVQRSAFTGFTDSGSLYFIACAETITARDCLQWGTAVPFYAPDTTAPDPSGEVNAAMAKPQIYRIKGYRTTGSASLPFINTSADSNISAPWLLADNVILSTEAAAVLFDPVVASFVSAGAFIDRNTWAAPNDSDAKYLGSTLISFAAWKADGFDTNGGTTTPTWNNPAIGDFS